LSVVISLQGKSTGKQKYMGHKNFEGERCLLCRCIRWLMFVKIIAQRTSLILRQCEDVAESPSAIEWHWSRFYSRLFRVPHRSIGLNHSCTDRGQIWTWIWKVRNKCFARSLQVACRAVNVEGDYGAVCWRSASRIYAATAVSTCHTTIARTVYDRDPLEA